MCRFLCFRTNKTRCAHTCPSNLSWHTDMTCPCLHEQSAHHMELRSSVYPSVLPTLPTCRSWRAKASGSYAACIFCSQHRDLCMAARLLSERRNDWEKSDEKAFKAFWKSLSNLQTSWKSQEETQNGLHPDLWGPATFLQNEHSKERALRNAILDTPSSYL